MPSKRAVSKSLWAAAWNSKSAVNTASVQIRRSVAVAISRDRHIGGGFGDDAVGRVGGKLRGRIDLEANDPTLETRHSEQCRRLVGCDREMGERRGGRPVQHLPGLHIDGPDLLGAMLVATVRRSAVH